MTIEKMIKALTPKYEAVILTAKEAAAIIEKLEAAETLAKYVDDRFCWNGGMDPETGEAVEYEYMTDSIMIDEYYKAGK